MLQWWEGIKKNPVARHLIIIWNLISLILLTFQSELFWGHSDFYTFCISHYSKLLYVVLQAGSPTPEHCYLVFAMLKYQNESHWNDPLKCFKKGGHSVRTDLDLNYACSMCTT